MRARNFDMASDYKEISNWYRERKLPVAPPSYLTRNGFIVEEAGLKVCSGFLYQMDKTPMYSLDAIVANPAATKEQRKAAINLLIEAATDRAQLLGGDLLLAFSHTEGLTKSLEAAGFGDSERIYKHMGKRI